MHILFLADASSVHSHRWIKYFSKIKGIKVTWCSMTENTMPTLDNVSYKFIDRKNPLSVIKTIRYISKAAPDIIHVHYLGWNGFLSLFIPKSKIVLTPWGTDIVFNTKNLFKRILIKKMLRRASLITCDAAHLKNSLIKLGALKNNIKLIMFGIDKEHFKETRPPFYKNSKDRISIIGSIRNLHPVYDVATFLKAAKIILEKRTDVIFQVAGSGPELSTLENFVMTHKLEKNITFLGRIKSEQLTNFYNNLDIYVSTSLSDGGIASSTAEAMLCSRPVIITNAAENAKWVIDKKNGCLFEPGDYHGLADTLNYLIENKSFSIEIGQKAKTTVLSYNEYSNEMKKMLHHYERLCFQN